MRKKDLLALLIIALVATSLIGCGKEENPNTEISSEKSNPITNIVDASSTFSDRITIDRHDAETVGPLMAEVMELLEILNNDYENMKEEASEDNGDGTFTIHWGGYSFSYKNMAKATEQFSVIDENGIIFKPRHVEYRDMTDSYLLDKYDIQLNGKIIVGETYAGEEFYYISDKSFIEALDNKDSEIKTSHGFEYIEIENGIEILGLENNNDFDGNIVIPDVIDNIEVVSIGDDAFNFENYEMIDKRAYEVEKEEIVGDVNEIVLPVGLESIGDYAFANNKLKALTIPNTVKSIGYRAFYNNFINEVVFDGKVTDVGNQVFYINTHYFPYQNIEGDYSGKWVFGENISWEREGNVDTDNQNPVYSNIRGNNYKSMNRPDPVGDYSDYEWIDVGNFYSEVTPAPYTTIALREDGLEVVRGDDTSEYMFVASEVSIYTEGTYANFKDSIVIGNEMLSLEDVENGKLINFGELVIPLKNGVNKSGDNQDIAQLLSMNKTFQTFPFKSYYLYEKKN